MVIAFFSNDLSVRGVMEIALVELKPAYYRVDAQVQRADYWPNYEDELRKIRRNMQLKGFRPGQVPKSVAEARVGGQLLEEVFEKALNEAINSKLQEANLGMFCPAQPVERGEQIDLRSNEQVNLSFYLGLTAPFTPEVDQEVQVHELQPVTNDQWKRFFDELLLLTGRRESLEKAPEVPGDTVLRLALGATPDGEKPFEPVGSFDVPFAALPQELQKAFAGAAAQATYECAELPAFDIPSPHYSALWQRTRKHAEEQPHAKGFRFILAGAYNLTPATLTHDLLKTFFPQADDPGEKATPEQLADAFKAGYLELIKRFLTLEDGFQAVQQLSAQATLELEKEELFNLVNPAYRGDDPAKFDGLFQPFRAHLAQEKFKAALSLRLAQDKVQEDEDKTKELAGYGAFRAASPSMQASIPAPHYALYPQLSAQYFGNQKQLFSWISSLLAEGYAGTCILKACPHKVLPVTLDDIDCLSLRPYALEAIDN